MSPRRQNQPKKSTTTPAPRPTPITSNVVEDKEERLIPVASAEKQDGQMEYKRQVHTPIPSRLRSLATQMSYRLDQGNGTCTYMIGVEDDGCHSLLDYASVSESARVLECIARSLNSIVLERRMIQNEVSLEDGGDKAKKIENVMSVVLDEKLGGDEDEKKSSEDKISAEAGVLTRCELVIQRVETHMLDMAPSSLSALARSVTDCSLEGNATATAPSHVSIEETLSQRNIRVAVVGNVDAGKSTLIGTLTSSTLDDGRGKSRTTIMKHRHEIESGRTSTATTHLLGFKSTGEPIHGRDSIRVNKRKSEDEIARESERIITLMDLAGHEKYLKTTIHGVSAGMADYALILVNSRHPPTHMTQHHLNLCVSFSIPVLVVFTKVDGCPDHSLKHSKEEVFKILTAPDVGKRPFAVRCEKDIATCMGKLNSLAPVIETSCVTGEGMDLLRKVLFALPKRRHHEKKVGRPFEFLVEDVFLNVPGVGVVVSGFVNAGDLDVGSSCAVYVGPTDDGTFLKTFAKSAHISRINTSHITSGQSACLAFSLSKDLRKKLRRGMVVLKENPTSTKEFDAEICVLKGEGTTIRRSYQAYVHILNVRQSAYAKNIELVNNNVMGVPTHGASIDDCGEEGAEESIVLRPGSRAKVRFEFAKRPEYVRPGMRMLFRDGRVRGVGIITGIPSVKVVT